MTNTIMKFTEENFKVPPFFHHPYYSWIWNDALSEEEVTKQLEYMSACGIKNIYIIPISENFRPDTMKTRLSPEYLSDDYLYIFSYTLKKGKELGIKLWLYDEDAWPSASASGNVVKNNPELIQKSLSSYTISLKKGEVFDKPCLAAFLKMSKLSLPYTASHNVDIDVFYVKEMHSFNMPYPDIFDLRTAEKFFDETHAKYIEKVPSLMNFAFIDEPNICQAPWTHNLEKKFIERFGYDITDYLPALIIPGSMGDQGQKARIDYYSLLLDLVENFYTTLKSLCNKHNLFLTGHADGDDTIKTYWQNIHLLKTLRTMDIPGIDVIYRQIFPSDEYNFELDFKDFVMKRTLAENRFFPRMAHSAANQNGTLYALSESFAVYGNGLTYDQMRYIINFQAIRGINIFNLMNITYSGSAGLLTGLRPNFCENSPGSADKKVLNLYIARLCYIMSLGKPGIKTALYYPIYDMWAGGAVSQTAAESFESAGKLLDLKNINFDIIDDEIILKSKINTSICAGLSEYNTVIIPQNEFMPQETKDKLKLFSEQGVKIIPADRIAMEPDLYPMHFIELDNKNIKSTVRILENEYIYFLCNETFTIQSTVLNVSNDMLLYELDLINGQIFSAEKKNYSFVLQCGEGKAFLLTHEFISDTKNISVYDLKNKITITHAAIFGLNQYRLTHDKIQKTVCGDNSLNRPDFSGDILYKAKFSIDTSLCGKEFIIALSEVYYSCEIFLNGHSLGTLCFKPFILKASTEFLSRENTLEIRVSNTLANQFVHSSVFDKYSYKSIGTYHYAEVEFEKESCRSGAQLPIQIYY